MYESDQVHGLKNDSAIKLTLDTWYKNNLQENYAQYISIEAGFCGDRTSTTNSSGEPDDTGGTGRTVTYYGTRYRLDTNNNPTFECLDEVHDLYTVSGASNGNKALEYPIGLITADEVVYAGGKVGASNSAYYLYVGTQSGSVSGFWTMSPECFNGNNTHVFGVGSNGQLYDVLVDTSVYGVRPVINLSSTVSLVGTGTSADPYRVV